MADNPLSNADLAKLNELLASCARTRELLEKCEKCGLDVSEQHAANGGHEAFAKAAKAQFFPHHS